MEADVTFHRIGAAPGGRLELEPSPWQPSDRPVSEGMVPQARSCYADRGGKVSSGIWSCNAGTVEIVDNPVEEICFVISGTVKVTDRRGRDETFGAGECLVLPRGFSGLWSQSDGFAKFYVVVEGL